MRVPTRGIPRTGPDPAPASSPSPSSAGSPRRCRSPGRPCRQPSTASDSPLCLAVMLQLRARPRDVPLLVRRAGAGVLPDERARRLRAVEDVHALPALGVLHLVGAASPAASRPTSARPTSVDRRRAELGRVRPRRLEGQPRPDVAERVLPVGDRRRHDLLGAHASSRRRAPPSWPAGSPRPPPWPGRAAPSSCRAGTRRSGRPRRWACSCPSS